MNIKTLFGLAVAISSSLLVAEAISAPKPAPQNSIFPRGCEVSGFAFNQNLLTLNESGNQSYYLVQNITNTRIELERQDNEESFMSPPLLASLDATNWAAFASDVKNLNFRCFKHVGDTTQQINCQEALEVCQYPRVKFALSNMGNYWISTNKSQYQVIQDSVAKGVYLKW